MLGSERTSSPEEDNSASPFDTSSIAVSSLMNSATCTLNQNNDGMLSKLILQQAALYGSNLIHASNSSQSSSSMSGRQHVSDASNNHGNQMIHDCFFTPSTTIENTNNHDQQQHYHTLFGSSGNNSENFDSFLMSLNSPASSQQQQQPSSTTNNVQKQSNNSEQHQQPSSSSSTFLFNSPIQQGLLPNSTTNSMGLSEHDAMIISEVFTPSNHLQPATGGHADSVVPSKQKKDSNCQLSNFGVGGACSSTTADSSLMKSSSNNTQFIECNNGNLQSSYMMPGASTSSTTGNSSSANNQGCSSNTNNASNNSSSQLSEQQSSNQQTRDENPSGSNLHPIACTRCRERHKRCDRKLPQCSYCEKQGLQCVYTTPKKQRRVYQRAVPVPAGNDVSSITMVTGGGSSGSFFTSSRTPIANPGTLNLFTRRGSVDSTFSNISTATSGGISTTSSNAGTTSGSSGNELEAPNAFEIFTFRWQAGGSTPNTKSDKKRKSLSEPNVQNTKHSPSKSHHMDTSSHVQEQSMENYSFPKKRTKKSGKKLKSAQSSNINNNNQYSMMDNQTNTTFNQDNQSIYYNNQNNMDTINSSISSLISQGLLMNQQKEITPEHINILGTSNQNVPTIMVNLDNNMLFGNQSASFNSNRDQNNIIMNASIFKKPYFDFYFRYISLGYNWVPQEVFDSLLFGTEAMSSVFGNDIMSLLYAIHAITSFVKGNTVEADMAYHKSELLLPPLPDNSLTSLLNNGSLTINSAHSVARNLVLAHYLLIVGNLQGSKRYLRLADGVLSKYSPNYMNQVYINCMASADEEDAGGLTHESSIFANLPNQIMLLMKYRVYVGFKYDEIQFIMDRGLDYVNSMINFTQNIPSRNHPLSSVCLPEDCTISFRSFVGMSMLTSYLHATGTIPNEILTITSQPLSSENIKIYLTLSLLLRKKIKGQSKARMQMYSGNQEAVMASPLSLLIDLFSLSCSILMLHETMCNQGLYQNSTTDQLQYTSVMFQYADQMKDIITQIPTESIDVSYMYMGILYLLVMYFKQLEEIENQAISKGFSLHTNEIFHKQLASLSIVHKFIAVITNKYPVVMEKYKSTVERIGLFLNKYQLVNYQ